MSRKMSALFIIMLMACVFLATGNITAYAYTENLHFSWTMTNAPADLAGYRIYQDGKRIAEIPDPAATELIGPFNITGGPQLYEISAYDKGGTEGPKSAPFPFDPAPGGVTGFTVTTGGI